MLTDLRTAEMIKYASNAFLATKISFINEIANILERHSAPIILGTNPRRQVERHSSETPFGTVIAIDFDHAELAFMMQEEHPTPDRAIARCAGSGSSIAGSSGAALQRK